MGIYCYFQIWRWRSNWRRWNRSTLVHLLVIISKFWVIQDPQEGDVFGGPNNWKGLGIFVDTYDNDGQKDNPVITVWNNDGTKTYTMIDDGKSGALTSCNPQNWKRNPYVNAKLKVVYSGKS